MLATAAKLSRALAATFDVFLSELALEVQLEALLQVTQYPLPASAGIWAGGFWQIVSIKETNIFFSTPPIMSVAFSFSLSPHGPVLA